MKVTVDVEYITNNNPQIGFYLFFHKKLYKITNANRIDNETILTCNHEFSEEVVRVYSKDVSKCLIKFIAKTPKIMYSVIHRDYSIIIDRLKDASINGVDGNNDPYNGDADSLLYDVLHKVTILHAEGSVAPIYSKLTMEDHVEITNIDIIDEHKLSKINRICKVSSVINKGAKSRYILSVITTGQVLNAVRKDFKIVGKNNYKDLFSIR